MPPPVSTDPTPASPRAHFVFHGHFYQPPRESPWTGEVERQPSASPYWDWNQRITDECYRPLLSAPILGPHGQVAERVNCWEYLAFDVGPTLMRWLRMLRTLGIPHTVQTVVDEDERRSLRQRSGSGSLPQIFIDGESIGGYDALAELHGSGGLERLRPI